MTNLRDLDHEGLLALMADLGERRFRADQLFRWVHGRAAADLAEMTDISKALRERLRPAVTLDPGLSVDLAQVSVDGTRKLRLRTADDRLIETVLIPDADARAEAVRPTAGLPEEPSLARPAPARPGPGDAGSDDEDDEGEGAAGRLKLTQCLSSQVGCAIDCRFCATAALGFGRHLSTAEIVSQVYLAERLLAALPEDDPTRLAGGPRVTNLVFMGMGEPLHNYENVVRALRVLLHPLGRDFSRRRITVSTAGLVPAIERLAQEKVGVGVNLAVSLNASTDEQRDQVMPINRKYGLSALTAALRRYPLERRQRITIEYVLLAGVNDTLDDARRLPALLAGIPCKINLIPWNPHPQAPYRRPARVQVLAFQAELQRLGFTVYLRKTRGVDIDAACGQLAAAFDPRAGRPEKDKDRRRTEKQIALPILPIL